jgi:hypothetical protein
MSRSLRKLTPPRRTPSRSAVPMTGEPTPVPVRRPPAAVRWWRMPDGKPASARIPGFMRGWNSPAPEGWAIEGSEAEAEMKKEAGA